MKKALIGSLLALIAAYACTAGCSSGEPEFCEEQTEKSQYGYCEVRWTDCEDLATYVVECNLYGSGEWQCDCFRNGEQGQSLYPKNNECPGIAAVNERCGWDL